MRMQLFCGRGKVAQVGGIGSTQKVPGRHISQGQQGAMAAWRKSAGAPALGAGTPDAIECDGQVHPPGPRRTSGAGACRDGAARDREDTKTRGRSLGD